MINNVHLLRRVVIVGAMVALLAGCGGGSEPQDPKQAEPAPAPRAFTLEELTAALPGEDDVAGASRVAYRCPQDKDRCGDPDEGERASVDITLAPAGDSAAEIEQAANESIFGNSVTVSVRRLESASAAEKVFAEGRARDEKFDGSYDIEQEGDIKTGAVPAEKGKGALEELEIDAWKGYVLDRRGTMAVDDQSEPRLISTADVLQGTAIISVFVNVHSEGRSADYAAELARKSLDDYLERLG